MSQIGTLGDIVFKVTNSTVRTFDALNITSSVNYATHNRHNKKPLSEFQYKELDKATFTIYLSAYLGVNPMDMIKKIDDNMNEGKILSLIIGGKKYGSKWVIVSNGKEFKQFDNKGNLLIAKCSISLQEYAER